MYWRVRKYGPIDILKKYGLLMLLVFSVFINFILIVTRPNPKKTITVDLKRDMDQFARKVATHILDTSYISYAPSTMALIDSNGGELAPDVVASLRQSQLIPNDQEEMKANVQTYTDQKRVVAVKIDRVDIADPNAQSLVPIDVYGLVAVHAADEAGPPTPFHFQFLVGYRNNTQIPIVATFRDLSPGT